MTTPPHHAPISIAMATYKGGKYIAEQLQSLVTQTLPPAEIVICDDASPDDTVTQIKSFAATSPVPIRLYENPQNLRVIKNFEKAISLCTSPYIALCDQDDVWLPTKLEDTLTLMQAEEQLYGTNTPLLVHTAFTAVDAGLTPLPGLKVPAPTHKGTPLMLLPPLWRLALRNTVTGCTALLNRALVEAALPIPPHAMMHDHWLALVATAKGHLVTLEKPTMLYRQHGANVVGAATKSLWARLCGLPKGKWQQFQQVLALNAQQN